MDKVVMEVLPREEKGKQQVKALRRRGLVPAVLYGRKVENQLLAIPERVLEKLMKTVSMRNTIFELKMEGRTGFLNAIVHDMQMHPVNRNIIHVDLYGISMDEKITVTVPIKITGEAKGAEMGGIMVQKMHDVEVECFPSDIPSEVVLDVTDLGIGDSLHVKHLHVSNAEILAETEWTVITMQPPKVSTMTEEEEGETVVETEEDSGI